MSKLPELNKPLNTKDFHVDATPNGKYAIRILKCYLERARVKFKVEGMEDSEIKLFDYMNVCQDKREKELITAISILEGKE